ncbi:hypothetical protein CTKA_00839 [Chthonomonas calidirosea]|uniref:Uncharacterized protein TP-0789 domain-containing protein n=1 Tax=Chthonomonas calidirosea (strain DSM 23976 / ICMP 18418 / T49) TaxID=1303518 RepID=S0ET02_CHTCT|nr:outer membrane lipoprotein-sorting protein [Chthonomonas calidirosea]CCW34155.1 hypothetical protein CCALI_00318 [Chthonomonas calidirosea T49]CEK15602.1 hypothetical protein CTKA_00839 [Chthonomonas calidirosea]
MHISAGSRRATLQSRKGDVSPWPFLCFILFLCFVGSSLRAQHIITRKAPNDPDLVSQLTDLKSLEAILHITSSNSEVLAHIGPDFARNYAIHKLLLLYKAPDKLRLDGQSTAFGDAVLIYNGPYRFYAVPKLHLRKKEDLTDHPVQRQSLLEYVGLITSETLDFMQAHFVQTDDKQGHQLLVFELHYIHHPNSTFYRIWLDPEKHFVVKREWYSADGKLKAAFCYLMPRQVAPSLWIPTHIQVRDAEGNIAADTELEKIRVDEPLSDELFATGN